VSVVLIHAIPTFSYLWRNVIPSLVEDGLEVLTVDLLGYGDSDKPSDTDAFHGLRWQPGTIVGHDISGGVAQLICVDHLKNVERLMLIDSIAYDSFPNPV
jgi:2-hydroxymuconate-semialdehyde hydrolase